MDFPGGKHYAKRQKSSGPTTAAGDKLFYKTPNKSLAIFFIFA
jgi:hypothetical protein